MSKERHLLDKSADLLVIEQTVLCSDWQYFFSSPLLTDPTSITPIMGLKLTHGLVLPY